METLASNPEDRRLALRWLRGAREIRGALLVSLVLHALGLWLARGEPRRALEPEPPESGSYGELIWMEGPMRRAPEPRPPLEASTEAPEPVPVKPAAPSGARKTKKRVAAKALQPDASGSTRPGEASTARRETEPGPGGSLLRMRPADLGTPPGGEPVGVLGGRSAMVDVVQRVRDPAPAGTGEARYPKRKVIGDYSFERTPDGRLTYRDPQGDFLAALLPDGQVEFESRAPVVGGICAAGVCVTAGGLRKDKERKREKLNRVRVRFAPVLVGMSLQFGSTRGIPKKQLDFLDATFEARLRMRMRVARRRQAQALKGLSQEMARIWRTRARPKAKALILHRVFDLKEPVDVPQELEPGDRAMLRELGEDERKAYETVCTQVQRFIRRHLEQKVADGFVLDDLRRVQERCAQLQD